MFVKGDGKHLLGASISSFGTAGGSRRQARPKRLTSIGLFKRNIFSFWLLSCRSPESEGIEDEKVSSPKWSNHCQPLRCSCSSELRLSLCQVWSQKCKLTRLRCWPRVTGLRYEPLSRIAQRRSGRISPHPVCEMQALGRKSWKPVL